MGSAFLELDELGELARAADANGYGGFMEEFAERIVGPLA
jgi:hypothetical protein